MWASQLFSAGFSQRFLGTFLQPPCPLCSRPAKSTICCDCSQQIQGCQMSAPYQQERSEVPVFSWGTYTGTLKRAIQAMKYQNCPEIAIQLGIFLGQLWLKKGQSFLDSSPLTQKATDIAADGQPPSLIVVPIPLHADRLKERGYNQAAMIAQGFCAITQQPCLAKGLLRIRGTAAQFHLGPQDRQQNIAGAFRLGPDWTIDKMSASVLLLDDIYTTGTTAHAAATELRRSGIRVVGIGTAARAILAHSEPKTIVLKHHPQRQKSNSSLNL